MNCSTWVEIERDLDDAGSRVEVHRLYVTGDAEWTAQGIHVSHVSVEEGALEWDALTPREQETVRDALAEELVLLTHTVHDSRGPSGCPLCREARDYAIWSAEQDARREGRS